MDGAMDDAMDDAMGAPGLSGWPGFTGWAALAVLGLAAAALAAAAAGAWRWRRLGAALRARLLDAPLPGPQAAAPASAAALDTLPPPVQRYLRRAMLRADAAAVVGATLAHQGLFNLGTATQPRWRPFVSRQEVNVATPPGFVWDARIRLGPGVAVHVHDAYVGGAGELRAALLGLVDLARGADREALARGELMRWLAEAAWYPGALLPRPGLRWQPIDDHSARVTVEDAGLDASLSFVFGADGYIESVRADARPRIVDGRNLPAPWEGRWSDWREHDGLVVPHAGEVAWLLPEGRLPYWRGRLTALAYRRGG